MLDVVEPSGRKNSLRHASKELRGDRAFMLQAAKLHSHAQRFAALALQDDAELAAGSEGRRTPQTQRDPASCPLERGTRRGEREGMWV